ncbi:RHS repeat-associated core domain-containing protein [Streptacidiphilus cavernicola]|uniref:RHS repeat-associated core domain-containing protein n=1 Tax=Streptacidiphilus cavernicola TaxID=3342716 RepID=A0ABV6W661_9ACTN
MRAGVYRTRPPRFGKLDWKRRIVVALCLSLVANGAAAATAFAAPSRASAPPRQGGSADFGTAASSSHDLAVSGSGDGDGYHIQVAHESSGFAWHEAALLHPGGLDESSWTGYQCTSGDGRYEAVAVAPASAANSTAGRGHGAFAYSVDLATGRVRTIASGVALVYHSPGCGTGDTAEFTVMLGDDEQTTEIVSADLGSGRVEHTSRVAGQLTSVVPTASGVIGVLGDRLVSLPESGPRAGLPRTVATVPGQAYDLRPAADGGVDFLVAAAGSGTARLQHERGGAVTDSGSGSTSRLSLFSGRGGHNIVTGADHVGAGASVRAVDTKSITDPLTVSLGGDAVFGGQQQKKDAGAAQASTVLATRTGRLVTQPFDSATPAAATTATSAFVPAGVRRNALNADPSASAAPAGTASARTASAAAQTPACSVPRNSPTFQTMQQGSSQIDWAAQMAEQNLLTGSAYARPANFDNMGLVSYSPNSDFAAVPLLHPSSDTWSTVPRSVFEAIMAQESNWDQASWHALPGIPGNPVIADYYGAAGTVDTIDYAAADCGYGISQVTTGMFASQTGQQYSAHGQWKIAVDYQENIAAGLQILERTWNSLYSAGITANGGDPRYLENWYFAIWAYNTGIEPDAKHGNTTGCTPGPGCVGADGTWGLGWANNPANPSYPPNRAPYLAYTYADAAHPASWPYQERVLGWMGTPLVRLGTRAYAQATFNGGSNWLDIPAFNTFCTTADDLCTPGAANQSGNCTLADLECWWHAPVSWIPTCSTACSTSPYTVGSGSTEPPVTDPHPPVCSLDTGVVPTTSNGPPVIVAAQVGLAAGRTPLNIAGCPATSNWSNGGTFTMAYGTDAAGDPTGAIDTHQLGAGFGGYIMFDHTQSGGEPAVVNTGTWTPTLPSVQYYKVKIHIPATGARATDVVYAVNPGGGASPWKIRVNQAWGSDQWVTIGTFAMSPGGTVSLSNQSAMTPGGYDVGYDAVAFLPQGGTPGTPIGGPPGITDAPAGSNPAWVQCGCATRTAGDPVDTATGYYGETVADLSTPGRGMPLSFTRSYDSALADPAGPGGANAVNGPFGYGWTFSYNLSATTDGSTGNVTIRQEDGSQLTFVDTSGSYTPSAPRYDATLTKNGSSYILTRKGKQIYTFDTATGHLLSETDQAGAHATTPYATTLGYSGGQLSTITDPAGHVYTLGWSGGHITSLSDTAGRQVGYAYDSSGDLTDVYGVGTTRNPTPQDDDHTVYGYSTASHLLTSWRQAAFFGDTTTSPAPVTSMVYDASERVIRQTDPTGHTTTFSYGPSSSPSLVAGQTLVTDPAGHQVLDTYQNGLLVSETKGYGSSTPSTSSYTYDPVSLGVTTATDPLGHVQTFAYDEHGNRISASDGLGNTTASTYDALDDLTSTISPLGVLTSYGYDQAGHIAVSGGTNNGALTFGLPTSITVSQPQQSAEIVDSNPAAPPTRTTAFFYDDAAHPGDETRVVDANGYTSSATFNSSGEALSKTDAMGDVSRYGYDAGTGRLTSAVSPNGTAAGTVPGCTPPAEGCTSYAYDAWGHVVRTTDPLGHATSAVYDADGNRTSSTDGDNRTTTYGYDPANRLTVTTNPDSTRTRSDYNPDGTTADTVDADNAKTLYGYDSQGRLTSRTDPDNRRTSYTYDADGHVLTSVNAADQTVTDGYDAAGHPTSTSYSDGVTPNVAYRYNSGGARTAMTDGTGTTTWSYDAFGEIVSKTNGAGAVVGYGYDNDGHQTSISYPGGPSQTVLQTFDKAGRQSTVTDWNAATTRFGYDNDGNLTSTAYPDGDTVTSTVDGADQSAGTVLSHGTSTLAAMAYTRDGAGQVLTSTPTGLPDPAQTFGYSATGQLTSASGTSTSSYGYDPAGSPTTVAGSAQGFDAASQLCWTLPGTATNSSPCASPPTGATSYTYSAVGDRAKTQPASGTASTFGYDQADRLTGFTGPSGSASYAYDGAGLRASTTTGGVTTRFTWNDAETADLLSDGTTSYLYGPAGAVEQLAGSTGYWYLHDALGSPKALVDGTGAVAASFGYDSYGRTTATTGSATTPLRFTGGYQDAESGLLYLQARYYDPATAQFLTRDPAIDLSRSAYGYAQDNPGNVTDRSGLCWPLCTIVIGAVLGAVGGAAGGIVNGVINGNLNLKDVMIDSVTGAVAGGASGLCGPECGIGATAMTDAAANGVGSFASSVLTQANDNGWGHVDYAHAGVEGLIGAGVGFGGGAWGAGMASNVESEFGSMVLSNGLADFFATGISGLDPLGLVSNPPPSFSSSGAGCGLGPAAA